MIIWLSIVKRLVRNKEKELYYEFIYPIDSAKATDYENAIKYMDEFFKLAEE